MIKWMLIALLFGATAVQAAVDWDPLYQRLEAENGASFQAWRPFYSSSVNGERWRKDYFWPIYTQKGFKDEYYGRFLFFGYSTDFSPETDRERTWVLPFYFQGTDAAGESYFALFPLGGTIHEFLGRDRIWFVLFPLFARSRINDVQTTSVLWPIGSKTSGERIERFRVWPMYGRSTLEGEFEKKFVLWPLYNSVRYTNDHNPGGGFVLIPIYGRVVTEKAVDQWFIPPFFRYSKGDSQRIIHAPYPFVQWMDGDIYRRYFWPIYGKKEVGSLKRQFVLWPIFWKSRVQRLDHDSHHFRVIPVFNYESDVMSRPGGGYESGEAFSRYWKLWPLMSWERNREDTRFRLLDLWPLRDTPGIERNWAPLWTLYRRTKSDGAINHRLLWGILYDQERAEGRYEWSLLKGLVEYKNIDNSRSVRLLFIRFGGEEEQP